MNTELPHRHEWVQLLGTTEHGRGIEHCLISDCEVVNEIRHMHHTPAHMTIMYQKLKVLNQVRNLESSINRTLPHRANI